MTPAAVIEAARPLLARCRPGRPFLLMLDFDGTLARIRRHPDKARLSAVWRRALLKLLKRPGLELAIISGRGLPDLRRRVALPGAAYVGNHGLAWSRTRLGPPAAQRRAWRLRAHRTLGDLRRLLKAWPGAFLEDKGLDLSVHVRALAPERRPAFTREVQALARRHGLRVRRGLKVLELRQRTGWDKGRAVRVLRATLPAGTPCLFAGDDVTDEAGFKALRRGPAFTLKIGPGPTAAHTRGRRRSLLALLQRLDRTLR